MSTGQVTARHFGAGVAVMTVDTGLQVECVVGYGIGCFSSRMRREPIEDSNVLLLPSAIRAPLTDWLLLLCVRACVCKGEGSWAGDTMGGDGGAHPRVEVGVEMGHGCSTPPGRQCALPLPSARRWLSNQGFQQTDCSNFALAAVGWTRMGGMGGDHGDRRLGAKYQAT